jgi:hypothetical protein
MRFARALAAAIALLGAAAVAQDDQQPFKPFDQETWLQTCRKLGASEAQVQAFVAEAAEQGTARAADHLMRALVPALDAAVKLSEAGDPRAALALSKLLADNKDPTVQGHVRYHLARAFLDGDDPEHTVDVLNEYLKHNANLTPLDDEVVYFYAQALAEVPSAEEAMRLFQAYLEWFPRASERYRATAHQRLNELRGQKDNPLHGVADGMKKVGRDLGQQKTGKPTQDKEKDLLVELDRLIEMFQEQEKKNSGPPSGNGPSQAPAANSGLVDGPSRVGNQNKVAGVADRWGNLKDQDRKAIEAEIQNQLPPESRKMLEEYFKKLGTGTGGGR